MSEPLANSQPTSNSTSRRDFIKTGTALAAGTALVSGLNVARFAHAAGDDQIKIALIGCGGRGTEACQQALSTKGDVKLIAMADAFPDRLDGSYKTISGKFPDRVDVPEERRFIGFDAYQKAIDSGVDMVLLTTPPGFRPIHFEAAVKAGKNIFMEKPVATDPTGIRRVLAAAEESKKKGLKVGVGLQRHHQANYIETIKRLQDGEIGDILATRVYWNGTTPWVRPRAQLEKEYKRPLTEMEYQMRNWYYFVWMCGDHIVEQHIHNLDVSNWLKGTHPIAANGMGGCEVRKGKDYGETFDHHCVEFTYPDGSRMYSQCRHIPGCWQDVSEHAIGSNGTVDINTAQINVKGGKSWRYTQPVKNAYQVEHDDLFAAIRNGTPYNEAEHGAHSTMTAIFGRMCTYSGLVLTWDEAINSQISVMPKEFTWQTTPPSVPDGDGFYPIPIPGKTKVV